MKLEMNKNSLFAILLRSPWWISFAVGGGIFAGLRLLVPPLYAGFFALPFLVIGCYAGWQQLRVPSAASVERRLAVIRALTLQEFQAQLEQAYRREGYAVTQPGDVEADLELAKGGRVSLVGCKRWKATQTGIEPLRQLLQARRKRDAHECIFISAGEVSANAAAFATQYDIRLLYGAELVRLLK